MSHWSKFMISVRRKRAMVVLGLLLLVGMGWMVWPFFVGPGHMQSFCETLPAGSLLAQIQTDAAQRGYRVSSLIEGRAFVVDSRSFGRFTCELRFGPDGLLSSKYSFND